MPAPSIKVLYNVEPAIEQGLKAVFAAETVPLPPGFTQRETAKLPNERIDISCQLGAATGHKCRIEHGSRADAWNAQVSFMLGTLRQVVDPSGANAVESNPADPDDKHNDARARIRELMQYAADKFGEQFFPYHVITSIKEAGTTPTLMDDTNCDVSEIVFDCLISIRSNAWPLTAPEPTPSANTADRTDITADSTLLSADAE